MDDIAATLLAADTVSADQFQFLAAGCMGYVLKLSGTDLVIKMQNAGLQELKDVEEKVYERLGSQPTIARCYGSIRVELKTGAPITPGLLLQYYENGTLRDLLNSTSPKVMARCQDMRQPWVRQILDGLAHLHLNGVIHGDFGIHNILVGKDWNACVADFGGSRLDGSPCLAGPSPRYKRSLLQIVGTSCEPTEKDDIFALGTILFEVFTGTEMYKDKSRDEVMECIDQDVFPDLAQIPQAKVRDTIKGCWKEKWVTVGEVREALSKAI